VNREHFLAFLWLRWRLRVNQVKRAGTLNAILTGILAVAALVASIGLFVVGVVVGALAMPQLSSAVRMYVWDGATLLFLFCWAVGLLADLQRSEGLAIDKILHLPVSPSGAFLINYISSFFSVALIMFIPGMVGLALGQVYPAGPAMLLAFPLLVAFVFAVTALTYQFQGWLASMMSNPRRRRTVIVMVTGGVILLAQLPQLVNIVRPWDIRPGNSAGKISEEEFGRQTQAINDEAKKRYEELIRKFKAGEIAEEELGRQTQAVSEETQKLQDELARKFKTGETTEEAKAAWARVERSIRLMNSLLPPGWLVLGAVELADGYVLTALLGTLGLGLIGAVSLWRAYRTTIRMYTAGGSGDGRRPAPATPTDQPAARSRMVEWNLPWVSEYAAAVATAGFRSLLRAPETKMLLVTPLIMVAAFGGAFLSLSQTPPQGIGPFIPIGILGMMMFSTMQLVGNQFGYDRDGFRAFVLSPVPRREILLGKNLSLAPVVLVLGLVVIVGVGFAFHLGVDQVVASGIQLITMYLLFCMISNLCSIYAPFAIPSSSLKAARPGSTVILILIGCMMVVPVVVGIPTIFPVIVETILVETCGVTGVPVSLMLSVVILAIVVCCYRWVLTWEGRLLAAREQRILEVVTGGTE